jgi:signal transduction histidine kinase
LSKKTTNETAEQNLLEVLRTRLNVLNTSVFLLADKLDREDGKTSDYLDRINRELDRIRDLITRMPDA